MRDEGRRNKRKSGNVEKWKSGKVGKWKGVRGDYGCRVETIPNSHLPVPNSHPPHAPSAASGTA